MAALNSNGSPNNIAIRGGNAFFMEVDMRTVLSVALLVFLSVPALAGDETRALHGRWDQFNTIGYVRFRDDGTFRWHRVKFGTLEGRYRLLDGGAIEMKTSPVPGIIATAEF